MVDIGTLRVDLSAPDAFCGEPDEFLTIRPPPTGVLDTGVVMFLGRIRDPSTLPESGLITTVTLAELSVGPLVASDEAERAARQLHLQQAEADVDPIPFDADAARRFGHVAASLWRHGRTASARSDDATIAAIALARDLPVHTMNPRDFAGIAGLEVVEVPSPAG